MQGMPNAEEQDEDPYVNLAEIVERDGYDATRVATFMPDGDKLVITEGCDSYFSVDLDKVEVQRLRDWLSRWLNNDVG